jgi:hypothetical protein
MGSLVNTIIRDAREYDDSERDSVLQAKVLASTAINHVFGIKMRI